MSQDFLTVWSDPHDVNPFFFFCQVEGRGVTFLKMTDGFHSGLPSAYDCFAESAKFKLYISYLQNRCLLVFFSSAGL